MATPTPTPLSSIPIVGSTENVGRGILFSLGAIIVGIILWVIIWQFGFIASLVSFVIAALTVKLYTIGAGGISRRTAPVVLGLILVGVVLAFLAGIASDALKVFVEDSKSSDYFGTLLSSDFWSFFGDNVFNNAELWSSYTSSIVIALLFAGLGTFSTIKSLFVRPSAPTEAKTVQQ